MAESAEPAALARSVHLAYGALRHPPAHAAQWLSPDKIRALQWRRLERMLRHACARSPLYRKRFRPTGMTPAEASRQALLAALLGVTVGIRTMPSTPFEPSGKYRIVQLSIPAWEPGRAEIPP